MLAYLLTVTPRAIRVPFCDLSVWLRLQPFPPADPNAPKRYTETRFGAQLLSAARSLLGSTVFGIALTVGLHYYKGMVMGLAIQTVMAPLNLLENPLVKALFVGNGLQPQDRLFDEKIARELTDADEVIDEHGQPVARHRLLGSNGGGGGAAGSGASTGSGSATQPSFEEVLLDTWDQGNKADLGPLMKVLNKTNVNHRTKEDQWTPLMILSGLGAKGAVSAIRAAKEMGANVAATDKEGWTALHWAAFHGSLSAAQELSSETSLLTVKDKEGLIPLETARKEGNDAVAAIYEKAMAGAGVGDESKKSK